MMDLDERKRRVMIKAYKLYTGDDSHSYFETGFVDENIVSSARNIHFKETEAYASYDWHRAPQVQYVLTLRGTLEFTTSLGDTFILKAGEVLIIATDTSGHGHKWKLLDSDPWIRAYVVIETPEINFINLS
jgi:hypothetical protein